MACQVTYNTVAGACLAAGDKERLERWRKLMRLEESTAGVLRTSRMDVSYGKSMGFPWFSMENPWFCIGFP